MQTPDQLFRRRVLANWSFQLRALRTAIDWTIALYIIVPALVYALFQYRAWWQAVPPWLEQVPSSWLYVVLYLFAWAGTIRFFIEEGDQLFLRSSKRWFQRQMELGILYSLMLQLFSTAVLLLLLLPFLRITYALNWWEIAGLGWWTAIYKMNLTLGRQWFEQRVWGWKRVLLKNGLFLVAFTLFFMIAQYYAILPLLFWNAVLAGIITAGILCRLRLRQRGTFLDDVQREREARMKIPAMLLANVLEKKGKQQKKTFLWRKSSRLFRGELQETRVTEFLIKSFVRSAVYRKIYVQFAILFGYTVWMVPPTVKMLVGVICWWLMDAWLRAYGKEKLATPLLKFWKLEEKAGERALRRSSFWLSLPILLILLVILGGTAWAR